MKKFLTAALSLSLVAGACLGMTGCKPKQEEVFDELFKATTATNFTAAIMQKDTYAKEAVTADSDYESWGTYSGTICVDFDNLLLSYNIASSSYYFEDGTAITEEDTAETYMFAQYDSTAKKDRYFVVMKNTDEDTKAEKPWLVQERTSKSSLQSYICEYSIYRVEEFSYQVTQMKVMSSLVEWNKDVEKYQITMGWNNYAMTLLDDDAGVFFSNENTKNEEYTEYTFSNVGATVVSIPDAAKAAVTDYIAKVPLVVA